MNQIIIEKLLERRNVHLTAFTANITFINTSPKMTPIIKKAALAASEASIKAVECEEIINLIKSLNRSQDGK